MPDRKIPHLPYHHTSQSQYPSSAAPPENTSRPMSLRKHPTTPSRQTPDHPMTRATQPRQFDAQTPAPHPTSRAAFDPSFSVQMHGLTPQARLRALSPLLDTLKRTSRSNSHTLSCQCKASVSTASPRAASLSHARWSVALQSHPSSPFRQFLKRRAQSIKHFSPDCDASPHVLPRRSDAPLRASLRVQVRRATPPGST